MIKAKFVYPFLLSLLACFASCVQDEENSGSAGANGRVLTVNYSFDTPTTRVTANSLERKVENVAILFYGTDNAYVACQMVTDVPSGNGSFSVELPNAIQAGVEYKLLVIGNYNEYRPGAEDQSLEDYTGTYSAMSYPKMKENIHAAVYGTDRISGLLPFYGHPADADNGDIMLTPSVGGGTELGLSVQFSRSVARFNLINRAASTLNIKWVKVCNYRDKGYHFHENLTSGPVVRGTAAGEPNPLPAGYVEPDEPYELGDEFQEFTSGGLYAFPNAVINTQQNDEKTTFLMIAGYYQGSSQLTYYRANMSENTTNQILKRNHIYTLTVNGVNQAGAGNEEGAADKNQNILDYDVDDKWEEESGNTVTDSDGNMLKLSRNTVILAGNAGASALVKVTVTEGTSWVPQWEDQAADYFDCVTVEGDPHSFNIIAREDNEDDKIRRGKLKVKLMGVSSDVIQYVDVMQLPNTQDPSLTLMVDGQMSDFSRNVPANGGTISLKVITGSAACQWQAEYSDGLLNLLKPNNPNIVNKVSTGANNGYLTLEFISNLSGNELSGTVKIWRLTSGTKDGTDPIEITFTQPPSRYVMQVFLNNSDDVEGLVIEAFDPTAGGATANCIIATRQFTVTLAQPQHYTLSVTSNFHKTSDAFVSNTATSPLRSGVLQTKQKTKENYSTITPVSYPSNIHLFWLHVFRMGPADDDINGTITVTATRKPEYDANIGPRTSTYAFNVTLRSSGCTIGEVLVPVLQPFYIADRNVGAPTRESYPKALNGSTTGYYSDEALYYPHYDFRGTLAYQYADAVRGCNDFERNYTTGRETSTITTKRWGLPDEAEWNAIIARLCMSKQRYFIMSPEYEDGKQIACWIPAATTSPTIAPYWVGVGSTAKAASLPYNYNTTAPTIVSRSNNYTRCVIRQ